MKESRRQLAVACLLNLAGSVLVLLAGAVVSEAHAVTGGRALGLVALAGVVALLAARGWSRLAVGAILAVTGLAIAGAASARLGDDGSFGWSTVTAVGGLLVATAGSLAVVRGRAWPTLGSRYESPANRPASAQDTWDAIDRGEDPTERAGNAHRPPSGG